MCSRRSRVVFLSSHGQGSITKGAVFSFHLAVKCRYYCRSHDENTRQCLTLVSISLFSTVPRLFGAPALAWSRRPCKQVLHRLYLSQHPGYGEHTREGLPFAIGWLGGRRRHSSSTTLAAVFSFFLPFLSFSQDLNPFTPGRNPSVPSSPPLDGRTLSNGYPLSSWAVFGTGYPGRPWVMTSRTNQEPELVSQVRYLCLQFNSAPISDSMYMDAYRIIGIHTAWVT